MKQILKQVLGVDVAQKELVVTLGRMYSDLTIELYAHKVLRNNKTGIISLLKWVTQLTDKGIRVQFVMEATGVYHQKFAYYLDEKGYDLSIVLPNKISNYMRTLEIKTITDKTASQAIARFGLERNIEFWKRPNKIYKELQQLTRERDQIVEERVIIKNQLHAENAEAEPNKRSLKRMNARIKFLNLQEKEIKDDIGKIVNADDTLKKEIDSLRTIPGVGMLTAVTVLSETNGFELIRNKRQLTSYAGLDIKEKVSGTSVKGKPKISKKGNRYLRKAMHLPSLSSVKYNESHKQLYVRLVSKSGIKMKGLIAVQRKLLELIYVIYKNKTTFKQNYEQEKRAYNLNIVNAL
ncbi:MAG: IS110 family transposase [Bacteroidales bacterium]|jgi:transposase|nr:IS110 family transposase [Bacteroidales bacterium]